ncbi:diacylglycerol/lipid kinase family protein [Billgrantia gudaonensis]|uniref:Lipid kinase, YegS/Rv2252/BmrU family n=1 Tax=Billgrantia gudaonensis TaxID=376427 RepID=A0A1G8ZJY8_9GAMM|nr:diacylglycerol kinase family protein [Halomonas gudaonensis]SDK15439.1 lipid kinase, YegS/Rv2252/BmrU family [Halomonas gudaonensis]
MHFWLIANAKAGDGSRGQAFWLDHLRQAGLTNVTLCDLGDDDWESQVRPGDRVLVAGGDGSVSRLARVCLEREATLGVLPSGTANDFARNLSLPEDPEALCRLMISGAPRRVDVAWIGEHLFLNVVHIGLGTLPTTQASPRLKQWFGRFSYLAVLLRKLKLQRGFKATIEHAEGRSRERWLTIAIASGAYFGGGQRIPNASLTDGRLTLAAIRHGSLPRLLRLLLITRFTSQPLENEEAVLTLAPTDCRIRLAQHKLVTADGERLGRFKELRFTTTPRALSVIGEPQ